MHRAHCESGSDEDDQTTVAPRDEPLASAYAMGWTEDGRCGLGAADLDPMQLCPRPIDLTALRVPAEQRFVCEMAATGSRHTLLLLRNCRSETCAGEDGARRRRTRMLLLVGLNQRGLCEEQGAEEAVPWSSAMGEPARVCAGDGTCFVVTRSGALYSFGHGAHGQLGLGSLQSQPSPCAVRALRKLRVRRVAAGGRHALCLTSEGRVFAWGCNARGQLGLGPDAPAHLTEPAAVALAGATDVSCGHEFSLATVSTVSAAGRPWVEVYGWGDASKGQLGADFNDALSRLPVANRALTRVLRRERQSVLAVAAGGWHCLVLAAPVGMVVSWGEGEYGAKHSIAALAS